jgi:hypothetical protein
MRLRYVRECAVCERCVPADIDRLTTINYVTLPPIFYREDTLCLTIEVNGWHYTLWSE